MSLKLFNASKINNIDTRTYLTSVGIAYGSIIWADPEGIMSIQDRYKLLEHPPYSKLMSFADRMVEENPDIGFLDFEHMYQQGDDPEKAATTIQKFKDSIRWIKNKYPTMKLGVYGVLPNTIKSHNPYQTSFESWQKRNNLYGPLAKHLDCLCPVLYSHWVDSNRWYSFAVTNFMEIKRILKEHLFEFEAHKIKIYPFIWPQFPKNVFDDPDESPVHRQWLDADYWNMQLEVISRYADGAIIYFPSDITWNEASQQPWWEVTKKFK